MTPPEQTVFYSIEKAIKSYRQFAQKNLNASGFEITIDQGLILNIIKDYPGISQQQIAANAFKDHASVTRIIENLVSRKLLHRDFHTGDRRRFNISITDLGLSFIAKMEPVVEANRKKAIADISAGEIDQLKQILQKITDNCK
jgi:MarR family transcriptional regulator for hemolysin